MNRWLRLLVPIQFTSRARDGAKMPNADGYSSDEYYTPKFIFDALNVEFDLDVAAPIGGVEWLPAKRSLSINDDGLTTPWQGRVWCNPPYSKASPWAMKMIDHNNGIALLPTSKSAWFGHVWQKASGILSVPSNFKMFVRPTGEPKPVFMPVMLFAFGDDNREILIKSQLGHVR